MFEIFSVYCKRGDIDNYPVGSLMSSPKFYSPTNSQTEMLGQIHNLEGHEGEGGTGPNESACGRQEREPMEPLLLLVQVTQANG